MTFVNDNNEVLETTDEVAITKQAVSFFGFKIKGDYSVNFKVPNNSVTRRVLNYEGPQMINQVAFTRQAFTLMRYGNPFLRGAIVIQDDEAGYLDCYFVSGNSNWVNLLQGLITELDFDSYRALANEISTERSVGNFFGTGNSTFKNGIVFPLIDFSYQYNKGTKNFFDLRICDSSYQYVSGTTYLSPQTTVFTEAYPCFLVSVLVQEILQQNGLKGSGSLFNDPIYQRLVITPAGDILRDDVPPVTVRLTNFSSVGVAQKCTGFTELYDPENVFASNRFTATRYALVNVLVTSVANSTTGTFVNFSIYVNGISRLTSINNPPAGYVLPYYETLRPGDYIEIYTTNDGAVNSLSIDVRFEIPKRIGALDYFTPNDFLTDIKSVDIIKFIVNYFGCTVYFQEASKTITINIIEKIRRENALDFSDYYLSHRAEYTVDQAKNNYVKLQEADETNLKTYNKNNKTQFGGGNLETDANLKDSLDLFTIPFGASDYNVCKNGFWQANVPLVNLEDDGNDPITYSSITPGTPSTYNCIANTIAINEVVRIVNDSPSNLGYFVCSSSAASGAQLQFYGLNTTATTTGKIYRQKISFNSIKPRILLVKELTDTRDFSDSASASTWPGTYYYRQDFSNQSNFGLQTGFHAHFAKRVTGLAIDNFKAGLNFGDINDITFTDPNIEEVYFNQISKILSNPTIRFQMLIPEAVFQSFDFSRFIYIKTETLDGYFIVDSIVNYRDGNTPVEVNVYML